MSLSAPNQVMLPHSTSLKSPYQRTLRSQAGANRACAHGTPSPPSLRSDTLYTSPSVFAGREALRSSSGVG
ncbi:hypothetical protein PGTUg99_027206 [Puccinia graminis f. sp. tritici]|uniref:Uncharacterized protein n=1 Tax=Puccinia graminis f. sp. tritici TaxID=56615 RepID=A0A5B0MYI9_PUCGR|nr:hypothetical protein PGTUg99_027206 [Puccinia graminis f. sp. tritici]